MGLIGLHLPNPSGNGCRHDDLFDEESRFHAHDRLLSHLTCVSQRKTGLLESPAQSPMPGGSGAVGNRMETKDASTPGKDPSKRPSHPPVRSSAHARRFWLTDFLAQYFWFIFKNVVGWIFILGSVPVGIALPGPGGLPLFLIGFALVTFPGKRRLTSRVMRGRGLAIETQLFTFLTALVSVLITGLLVWLAMERYEPLLETLHIPFPSLVGAMILALVVSWLVMRLSLRVVNYILRGMPLIRRRVRPWLRKHGVVLLPPRRKPLGNGMTEPQAEDEILEISERHTNRLRSFWEWLKPALRRMVAVGITAAIFFWIFKPIVQQWDQVHQRVLAIDAWRFVVASIMFAGFLFVFRVLSWRKLLQAFGHDLPLAPTTRIWSTSELARYVPGVIWQVVGRVFLVRPYGVSASVCSASQVLELVIFLLANVLVAIGCLIWLGNKQLQGEARFWLLSTVALVPLLIVLLHPRVFFRVLNRILESMNNPRLTPQVRKRTLSGLAIWSILGLLWQSLAVWLLVSEALGLPLTKWWVVAGAYCLAWCAGFLAVWAPGGIGVRELVFITAMRFALPPAVQAQFSDPEVLLGFLAFLSVLLRLWTVVGELILALIAYALDFRGALGRPDAPGRVAQASGTVV